MPLESEKENEQIKNKQNDVSSEVPRRGRPPANKEPEETPKVEYVKKELPSGVELKLFVLIPENTTFSGKYADNKNIVFEEGLQKIPMTMELFEQFAYSTFGSKHMKSRKIVVIGETPKDIQTRLKLPYKNGEILDILEAEEVLDYDAKTVEYLMGTLCEMHKRMMADIYYKHYQERDSRVTKSKVVAINKGTKGLARDEVSGLLKTVLIEMSEMEEDRY